MQEAAWRFLHGKKTIFLKEARICFLNQTSYNKNMIEKEEGIRWSILCRK